MKQFFHKTASFLMAFVVLFSTMSFTVDMHYCGDTLVDTAIFEKADSCGMNMMKSSSENEEISNKNCCRNDVHFIDGNEVEQLAIQKTELPNVYFAIAFISTFQDLSFSEPSEKPFHLYKPPLVNKDITVLFENFRI